MKVRHNKRRVYRAILGQAKKDWPDWLVAHNGKRKWIRLTAIRSLHMFLTTQRTADAAARALVAYLKRQTERT